MTKTDKITRKILNVYKSSDESLLSVLLKELIKSHNLTETRSVVTQTEPTNQHSLDLSIISSRSKPKRSKRKNHGLVNKEFKMRKPRRVKEVTAIAQNLEKMSSNISVITSKLDDFKRNPSRDESQSIIGHVGTIMHQLNGCISNFESLCRDIKQVNETRNRNYDEWMDDLQNSENGRRFLKKLQKSFSRVMDEEKSKLKNEFRKKLEREKSKLSRIRLSAIKNIDKKPDNYSETITKEINEIFTSTCMMIKNVETENELFEKALEADVARRRTESSQKASNVIAAKAQQPKINLNERRQIHSKESSSDPRYSSTSFENDDSDESNQK